MIESPASGRDRAVAGALSVGAVLFVVFAVPRAAVAGVGGALTLPSVLLAADLLIAAALVTRWYPIRPPAQGLAVFALLVHVLVVLRVGPVWTRGCAGVLALAEGWALVLMFLLTAAEQDDDADDADDADDDADDDGTGDEDDGSAGDYVETPVAELVELEPHELDPAAEPTPEPPPGAPAAGGHDQEERAR